MRRIQIPFIPLACPEGYKIMWVLEEDIYEIEDALPFVSNHNEPDNKYHDDIPDNYIRCQSYILCAVQEDIKKELKND